MKQLLFIGILLLSIQGYSQTVDIIKFNQLEEKYSNSPDTIYLINYWATWCKPCIEELPDFLKLNNDMQDEKFKMILVSLDFPSHMETRVIPFLTKNNVKPEVVLLDDDANIWINKVSKNWDGAIPATQIIKGEKKRFYGKQLNYNELKNIISQFNN